ncbi:MAG: molybdenum cofactor guanylyltransferase [Thermodesulfobacteriota bacterium]
MPTTSSTVRSTTGVILAGGASSRFGGNKALALLEGRPLIAHVADVLASVFTELLLVTNTPESYRFLGWPMAADIRPGQGPLAGIQAALRTMATDQACVVACDMPRIRADLLTLLAGQPGNWDVALPWLASGPEPLCAVYRKSCLPVIDDQLGKGQGAIYLALDQLCLRRVTAAEIVPLCGDLSLLRNINRQEDLRALLPAAGH